MTKRHRSCALCGAPLTHPATGRPCRFCSAACRQKAYRQRRTRRLRARSDEWRTPPEFFAACAKEFGPFDMNAAATSESALCQRYFTIADDALVQDWGTATVWCNPPYSALAAWVEKACRAARAGATVVMLVPASTDTGWWHDGVSAATEVRFLRGRLRFLDASGTVTGPARFASALLVLRPPDEGAASTVKAKRRRPREPGSQ